MLYKLLALSVAASLFTSVINSSNADAENMWHLGKGLLVGDSFTYKICDPLLSIKLKVKDTCYIAELEFKQITKNSSGKSWIVQTNIEYAGKIMNSTMQISALTFQVRSDYTMKPYAMSIQRTLFYINNYANIVAQKPLEIGKVWGHVAAYGSYDVKIAVRQLKTMEVGDFEVQAYKVGYEMMKESTLYIVDNFPFPVRAKVYMPTLAHPSPPLKFELEVLATANGTA